MLIGVLGGKGLLGQACSRYFSYLGATVFDIGKDYESHLETIHFDVLINANGNSKKYLAIQNPELDFKLSVASVRSSIERFQFKQYVYFSSGEVYGEQPTNTAESARGYDLFYNKNNVGAYGFHKIIAEIIVRKFCPNWLIFRLGGHVGPGLSKNPVFDLLNGLPLRVSGQSTFQFLRTDMVAQHVRSVIEKGIKNEVFNLTAHSPISVELMAEVFDIQPTFEPNPLKVINNLNTCRISQYVELCSTLTELELFKEGILCDSY